LVVPIKFIELRFQLGKLALQAKQTPRGEAVESLEDHGRPILIARHKGSERREAIDIYWLHFSQVTMMLAENRLTQFRWVRWSTEPSNQSLAAFSEQWELEVEHPKGSNPSFHSWDASSLSKPKTLARMPGARCMNSPPFTGEFEITGKPLSSQDGRPPHPLLPPFSPFPF
jgi:hypothetical protein